MGELKAQLAGEQRERADLEGQRNAIRVELAAQQAEVAKQKAAAAAAAQVPAACVDRHTPWLPSAERDKADPELGALLRKVAVGNEVLVAVSNSNYAQPGGMLEVWMQNVKRAGVKNAMVLALDDATKANVEQYGLPAYRMDVAIPDSQKNVGSNHAVSALKFRILTHFIKLGYAVLLSDVDIVTLQVGGGRAGCAASRTPGAAPCHASGAVRAAARPQVLAPLPSSVPHFVASMAAHPPPHPPPRAGPL